MTKGPEAIWREHLAEGRFMIQRAPSGAYVFYPRVAAPGTGERPLEWVEASGKGTVYSTTISRRRPEKGGDFNIALIDLDEGPRMMSRVVDIAPEDVRIGMKVTARIEDVKGQPAVVWVPA